MADEKKLMAQDTLDLVNLHRSTIEAGFMDAVRNRMDISDAMSGAQQMLVYSVYFSIGGSWGGMETYMAIDHKEVVANINGSNHSKLSELLRTKAVTAGHELVAHILDNGSRQLAWDRASRWQRLKWAWRGVIQPDG